MPPPPPPVKQAPVDKLAPASGIVAGKNHGHVVTKRDITPSRQARKKGVESKKAKFVRSLIREVSGLAPYEKRLMDMVKIFGTSADKKIYKMAKQRLGTHKRALKKREEIKDLIMQQRSRAA